MKQTLLDYLVCPIDHARLTAADGQIVCAQGHAFEVSGGLPNLVPGGPGAGGQQGTADSFGAKWSLVTDEDDERLMRHARDWYDRRYGWGDEQGLAAFLREQERILDAGCGLGRNVERYAQLSGAQVVGFDLSRAVELAYRDYDRLPNAHFLRADILAPPFEAASFDFVSADQVIHHTPDAERAFAALAALVRPGGQLAVYVYRRKALLRELADDKLRELTTRMSVEECMEFSAGLTELARELSRAGGTVTLERGVPLLGIAPGAHDVQRLIYWHFLKCYWNDDFGEQLSTLTNFDWYHPPYASRHTPDEVRSWCAEAGLEIVHLDVIESGISVRARRPPS